MAAPSDEQDELLQKLHKLINASGEKEDTFGSEMADDARVWRVYAKAARKHDSELLAQWNGTLDTLLIFAGLFSAVSTTFIIDSYKQMQPDYAQETFRLLLANASGTQYVEPSDHVAESARAVNCLWISSLIASLSTALIAILAKQWLASYPVSDRENLREWAQLRQYRFDSLQLWHMPVLIAVVPVLLHVSLMLFLAGLVVFLGAIDTGIMILALVLSTATYGLYGFTALSPVLWSSSPFRTPLTPVLHRTAHRCVDYTADAISRLYRMTGRFTCRFVSFIHVDYIIRRLVATVMSPTGFTLYSLAICTIVCFLAVQAVTRVIIELCSMFIGMIRRLCRLCYTAVHSLISTLHRLVRGIIFPQRLSAHRVDPWITQTFFSDRVAASALSWLGLNAETSDVYHAVLYGLGDAVRGVAVADDLALPLKTRICVQISELISSHASRDLEVMVMHLRAAYHLRGLASLRGVTDWSTDQLFAVKWGRSKMRTQRDYDTLLRVSTMLRTDEEGPHSYEPIAAFFGCRAGQEACESPSSILPSTAHAVAQHYSDFRFPRGSSVFRSSVLAILNALRSHLVECPDLAAKLLRSSFVDEEGAIETEAPSLTAKPPHDCGRASCEVTAYLAVILARHEFEYSNAFMLRDVEVHFKSRTFETFALFCRDLGYLGLCHHSRANLIFWLSRDNPFSQISLCGRDIASFVRRCDWMSTGPLIRLIQHLLHPDSLWCAPDSSDLTRDEGLDACLLSLDHSRRNGDLGIPEMRLLLDVACLEPLQRAPYWIHRILLERCATVLASAGDDGSDVECLVSKFIFCEAKGGRDGRSTRTWDLVLAVSQQILALAERARPWGLEGLCTALGKLRRRYTDKPQWKEMGDRVKHGAGFLKDPVWKAKNGADDIRDTIEEFCRAMNGEETRPESRSEGLQRKNASLSAVDEPESDGDAAHKVLELQIDDTLASTIMRP